MYKKEFTNGQFLLFGVFFQEKLSCFQQRIGFLWIFIPMCSRVQVGTTLVFLMFRSVVHFLIVTWQRRNQLCVLLNFIIVYSLLR